MIKAIIFDCFGVLTSDGWLAFRSRHFKEDTEAFEQSKALNIQMDRGLIRYEDFIQGIADLAAISYEQAKRQIESNATNEALFTYIRDSLKPQYHLGLLSNAGLNWLDELFLPSQVALFDEIVLSYQVGVTKPDERMYEAIMNKLGVLPEECLFTDDQPRYVEAAISLGMRGIVFSNTAQFIRDFEEIREGTT